MLHQAQNQTAIFVCESLYIGGQTPSTAQGFSIEEPERNVRISYVNC